MVKEFTYKGKTLEQLQSLTVNEFSKIVPTRQKRSLERLSEEHKKFIDKVHKKDVIKTHHREIIILPTFVGKVIKIYNGKEWFAVTIEPEMIAHRLGEFSLTRKLVSHSSPGVGATRSSAHVSVK